MAKLRLGVLISGRGSNLQALIDAVADSQYPAEIALVIANEPGARGLELARDAGIPTRLIPHRDFGSRLHFEEAIDSASREARPCCPRSRGFIPTGAP